MSRKQITVTIEDEGRDQNKKFLITEMYADQAERWAYRAILAIMRNGVEVPDGFENMSMAKMAEIGLKALSQIQWEDAQPLLDEMWGCIRRQEEKITRDLVADDTEEVATRIKLRSEVLKLHMDFLRAVASSK